MSTTVNLTPMRVKHKLPSNGTLLIYRTPREIETILGDLDGMTKPLWRLAWDFYTDPQDHEWRYEALPPVPKLKEEIEDKRNELFTPDVLWNLTPIQKRTLWWKVRHPKLGERGLAAQLADEYDIPVSEVRTQIQGMGAIPDFPTNILDQWVFTRFKVGEDFGPAFPPGIFEQDKLRAHIQNPTEHPVPHISLKGPVYSTHLKKIIYPPENYIQVWLNEKELACREYFRTYKQNGLGAQQINRFLIQISSGRLIKQPFTDIKIRFFFEETMEDKKKRLESEFGEVEWMDLPLCVLGEGASVPMNLSFGEELIERAIIPTCKCSIWDKVSHPGIENVCEHFTY